MKRVLPMSLRWDGWPVLIAALAAFAFTCFASALFNDGDTYWHLGAGQWILDHRTVPHTDPFSFTARGQAWTAHEWLSEVIMAGALALGSWAALSLLFAAAIAGTILLAGLYLKRFMEPLHAVAAIILLFIFLEPSLLARPHALAWPLLTGWTILLLRARERHSAPPLLAAALMLLWANMHASFIFGLALVPFFAFEALIGKGDRKAILLGWGGFFLLSLLAAFANPSGLQGLLYPFQVSSMKILPLIREWRPSNLSDDPIFFGISAVVVLLALLKRARPSPLRLLLIAGLFYLALTHVRHQPVFGIVSLLLVASAFRRDEGKERAAFPPAVSLFASLAVVLIAAARCSVPGVHKEGLTYPLSALAELPPGLAGQPVFNAYDLGGVLIFKGIAPFIDGRADMYGDELTLDASEIEQGDAQRFNAAVAKWGIRWVILHPGQGLIALLDRDPSWRRTHADRYAVVYVRGR